MIAIFSDSHDSRQPQIFMNGEYMNTPVSRPRERRHAGSNFRSAA
jgi:hypothetical protein